MEVIDPTSFSQKYDVDLTLFFEEVSSLFHFLERGKRCPVVTYTPDKI